MVRPSVRAKGFTLLELLIVLAILAILAVVLIIVLNPSETLKKTRDSQRLSDLSNLKTALGIYVTTSSAPNLDNGSVALGSSPNESCLNGTGANAFVYYSIPGGNGTIDGGAGTNPNTGTDTSASFQSGGSWARRNWSNSNENQTAHVTSEAVNGKGWLPVDFASLSGGSPIAALPIDPINSVTDTVDFSDLVYRYVCAGTGAAGKPSLVFEINAQLESAAYTTGADDKRATDGGDNAEMYEVGTSLKLLGDAGVPF